MCRQCIFKSALLSLMLSVVCIMPVQADDQGNKFHGNWTGFILMGPYVSKKLEANIWSGKDGQFEGIMLYLGTDCVSSLTGKLQSDKVLAFIEKTVSGKNCAKLETVQFNLRDDKVGSAVWRGDAKTPMPLGMAEISKRDTSPEMAELLATYHPGSPESVAILDAKKQQAEAALLNQKKLQSALTDEKFRKSFPESGLIGAWQGEFFDGIEPVVAEIAMWSGDFGGLKKIGGHIRLPKRGCFTDFVVNEDNGAITFGTGALFTPVSATCGFKLPNSDGNLELGESSKRLNIFFYIRKLNVDGSRKGNCVEGLDRDGCYALGVFRRAPMSAEMQTIISSNTESSFSKPNADMLALLRSDTVASDTVQKAHLAEAANNDEFFAKQKAAQEQYLEEQRQREREEFAKKNPAKVAKYRNAPPKEYNGPFAAFEGGSYLDAIYVGDFDEVRRQDRQYFTQWKSRTNVAAEKYKALAVLSGNQGFNDVGKKYENFDKEASLGLPVISAYMRAYGHISKKCLREDAVTFKLTTGKEAYEVHDGLGNYQYSVGPTSSERYFTVNKEFAEAFRRYGANDPSGSNLLATLFSGANASNDRLKDILIGVKQMMIKYKCDSPQIKKMESRLLDLYNILENK